MKEPKLKIMLRDFINKAIKEYPTLESKIIYKYILHHICLEHHEIFLEWCKELFNKEEK